MKYKFGKIDILCVGSIKKSDLYHEAQAEYVKRLTPYGKLVIAEADDELRLQKQMHPTAHKIALTIDGAALSSEEFAQNLAKLGINGKSHLQFIIGDADGLSRHIIAGCNAKISLSAMTFTHHMARILLLEQIYRSVRLLNNEPYHK
ncbi:MAG: 23S rRNA (pseudouridine(1915)-N(3))-methyltransferase RlmH [Defluviitaleaceae bacterium]|nr:23S rRNA (pseudouridine(1915)-N(3))-methyltransferase RlmH [Defluviitaleaceae bacterium]